MERRSYTAFHLTEPEEVIMVRIGVMLSGCGVYDGAEIHEATLSLLALARTGAEAVAMAPDIEQLHVVNHLSGSESSEETRHVLIESARIARGVIKDIREISYRDIDGLIIPGGFGAAKNLTNFAVKGELCDIDPGVKQLVVDMVRARKPVAALCIAPVVLARALMEETDITPVLTIGNDSDTAGKIEAMKARHADCTVTDFVYDEDNNLLSTPCYMLAQNISEVWEGIEKTVERCVQLANEG
jgi:enhancing lycopene biosynthesis protein 2